MEKNIKNTINTKNKKGYRMLCLLVGLPICIIITALGRTQLETDVNYIFRYLEQTYNHEFVIEEIIEPDPYDLYSNVIAEYKVSPIDNSEIVFTAGIKEKRTHKGNKVVRYYDNYLEIAKENITKKYIKNEYVINTKDDIPKITKEIYEDLCTIENELKKLGFSSQLPNLIVDLPITINNTTTNIQVSLSMQESAINMKLERYMKYYGE